MIAHALFYAIEAAVLACIALASLALAANALRRFGTPIRIGWGRLSLATWLGFAGVGFVFGERIGPEFVLPYHFCFWLAFGSALFWLLSLARRATGRRHE
jgi:hypothetical protein